MTKRNIFDENNLVSATEMTGAVPRAMDAEAAATMEDLTNARCSPVTDPVQPPQPGGSERPSGTHSQPKTTPGNHPAKRCSRCRRG